MDRKRVTYKNGQAALEFTLIFVILVSLLFGILGLWKWSVDNIVKRQKSYNATRLGAGSSSPGSPQIPYNAPEAGIPKGNYL